MPIDENALLGEYLIKVFGKEYKQYSNIFVSHLIHLDQCLDKNDFYFKNIPLISSKHVNTLVVLINHTSVDLSQHLKKFTQRNYDIIIFIILSVFTRVLYIALLEK